MYFLLILLLSSLNLFASTWGQYTKNILSELNKPKVSLIEVKLKYIEMPIWSFNKVKETFKDPRDLEFINFIQEKATNKPQKVPINKVFYTTFFPVFYNNDFYYLKNKDIKNDIIIIHLPSLSRVPIR